MQGVAGQTANLTEWQDSAGNVLSAVQANGGIVSSLGTSSTNQFFGNAGNTTLTGLYHTAIGAGALEGLTTGQKNTAVGNGSLKSLTTGVDNVAMGTFAGLSTNGSNNVMIGKSAGQSSTGSGNTVLGSYAGSNGGSRNVFLGYSAGAQETGSDRLYIANDNTTTPLIYGQFTGTGAGLTIHSQATDGTPLTVKGIAAQTANLTEWQDSSGNVLSGVDERGVLFSNAGTDVSNIMIGDDAGNSSLTGANLVLIGSSAGTNLISQSNNVAIGSNALSSATSIAGVTAIGVGAMKNVTYDSSYNSVAIGGSALESPTSAIAGRFTVAIGNLAGRYARGTSSVAIGQTAGMNTASDNVYVGASAGRENIGTDNTIIGASAGYGVSGTTNYNGNVLIGTASGRYITNGSYNTVVGQLSGNQLTTGDSNIFLGNYAGSQQTTNSNLLIVDNQQRADVATEVSNSILYGTMATSPASQTLRINAATSNYGAVSIIGNADVTQQVIRANSTQTANLTEWQDSAGNVLAAIAADGSLDLSYAGLRNIYENIIIVAANGGGDYTNIPDAAAVAASGDVIYLMPGTYDGKFSIPNGVDLVGADTGTVLITYDSSNPLDRGPLFTFNGDNYVGNVTFNNIKGGAYEVIKADGGQVSFTDIVLDWGLGAMDNTTYYGIRMYSTGGYLKVYNSVIRASASIGNSSSVVRAISHEPTGWQVDVTNTSVYTKSPVAGTAIALYMAISVGADFTGSSFTGIAPNDLGYAFYVSSGTIAPQGVTTVGRIFPNYNLTETDIKRTTNLGVAHFEPGAGEGTYSLMALGKTGFLADAAGTTPLTVKGTTGQTGNLTEWQNSSGTILAAIDSSGSASFGGGALSNVQLNITGTQESTNNSFGMYMGGLTLSPANNWNAYGLYSGGFDVVTTGKTIPNAYGSYIETVNNIGGGALTNNYGLYINDQNAGTNNYAIYTNAGLVRLGDATSIIGSSDATQLTVQANGTQTANLTEWQNSSGTALTVIDENGYLGIGTDTPEYILHVTGGNTLIKASSILTGSSSASNYGIYSSITDATTAQNAVSNAIFGQLLMTGSGGSTGADAGYFQIQLGGSSPAYMAGAAVNGQGINNTTSSGLTSFESTLSNSSVLTNLYGIDINNIINTGTISSTYGIYIGDMSAGTQTNTPYSIYASDANAYTYLAGNVGVGITDPLYKLHVAETDNIAIRGESTLSTGSTAYGVQGHAQTTNSSLSSYAAGVSGTINYAGTGAVSNAAGGYFGSLITGSAPNVANVSGVQVLASSNLPASHVRGFYLSNFGNNGSGSVNTVVGMQLGSFFNNGTVANTYGIEIGDLSTGTQTNTPYSIYASDADAYTYLAGNVGVGETNPTAKLQIKAATASTPGVIIQTSDNNTTNDLLQTRNSSGTSRFRITADSRVFMQPEIQSGTDIAFETNQTYLTTAGTIVPNKLAVNYAPSSNTGIVQLTGTQFAATNNATADISQASSEFIGARFSAKHSTTNALSNLTGGIFSIDSDDTGTVTNANAISVRANLSNVGANITNLRLLEVQTPSNSGTIGTAYGLYIEPQNEAGTNYAIYTDGTAASYLGGNVTVNGNLQVNTLNSASDIDVCVDASGILSDCSSSQRYKENIQDLNLGLDTVLQLHPVAFDWIESGQSSLGFIAEEVAVVAPQLVTYKNGQIEGVKYKQITALLTNAVQEQQLQITDNANVIATLQTDVQQLRDDVTALQQAGGVPSGSVTFADISAALQGNVLATLQVDDLTVNQSLSVANNFSVMGITSLSTSNIGTVSLPAGTQQLEVVFDTPYQSAPIVTLTPGEFIEGAYRVVNTSVNSFFVELQQVQTVDISFSWHAFDQVN